MHKLSFKSSLRFLMVLLLSLFIFGCAGGSTRGTGGITIDGRVFDVTGQPLADVEVIVLQTGDSTFSDQQGNFQITSQPLDSLELLFENERVSAQTRIEGVTRETNSVRATFRVDEQQQTVEQLEVEIETPSARPDEASRPGGASGGSDDDDSDEGDSDASGEESSGGSAGGSSDDDNDDDDSNDSHSNGNDDDEEGDEDSSSSDDDSELCEPTTEIGPIQAVSASSITVAGIRFQITPLTAISNDDGDELQVSELEIGQIVTVEGECLNDILVAEEIEREDEEDEDGEGDDDDDDESGGNDDD